ncbi:hypothetical protein [Streptomyces sp. NPDC003032]
MLFPKAMNLFRAGHATSETLVGAAMAALLVAGATGVQSAVMSHEGAGAVTAATGAQITQEVPEKDPIWG